MTAQTSCLACGDDRLDPVADLGDAPVLTGALFPTREAARGAVCGRLDLAVCLDCGHVQNVAFDPALVQYDVSYDNSLHFSATFQQYSDELVARLVDECGIRGKHVVEIGSGKGDFLASLSEAGGNTGIGYDPTVAPDTTIPGVTLVQDYFSPGDQVEKYELLACRHVLEHLDHPAAMLASLAESAPQEALFYFEVPSAEFNFGPDGLWDCIYPHVSYFSTESLSALVRRSGFEIVSLRRSFHGQFLSLEARARPDAASSSITTSDTTWTGADVSSSGRTGDVETHLALVRSFAERWRSTVARWQDEVVTLRERGESLAVWGAGSKGVNFVNAVDPDGQVTVVDLNPRKDGHYLPGAGHRVGLPESLAGRAVSQVLITNPVYYAEICDQVAQLGVVAKVVTV
ncbi:class I SAM-dependent methyltransferase [Phytoactinopolyspora halotolerans]|uniref:Class I SAM-dependent methyltransferase n=1 Tax=Phytoactinopolyspora halotolerans TaxID=1981512 RepID=A0A6L9S545_9ACTN|nr:class I SAM-dependent methyltransferase [Phytoactinopolyspora halotolerans]NED99617.1 class I SAM-dependent methyltransferase [Phytoactinopolyspora halotolerans]